MQGWGFSKNNNVNLNIKDKVQKKQQSVWQVANDNIIVVPDIDAQTQAIQTDVSNPTGLQVQKLVDFYDMQIQTRKNTLPSTQEGVDLSSMLSMVVTSEDLIEKDEAWEFSKLKTEVYELVSKLNKF